MASSFRFFFYFLSFIMLSNPITVFSANLSPNYYNSLCPNALPTIKRVVEDAIKQERRMGASLLRLHFHDCFVNGCDASILLDQTSNIDSEKFSLANNNSIRGFEVIDRIKREVDKACGHPIVSCADILTVAARDSVVALGGPTWKVQLGRRDSTTASRAKADADLPTPFMDLGQLIQSFENQGLNAKDLVALSGGHTLGFSKCSLFRARIYSDEDIDSEFASQRQSTCPQTGGDLNLAPLDQTAGQFDTNYFKNLVDEKGLLESDQILFSGGETEELVKSYSKNAGVFSKDFANSMIKMGNIKPLTGNNGQIRLNCKLVN